MMKILWIQAVLLLGAFGKAGAVTVCKTGFVQRLASEKDDVCVPPATQVRTVSENARAPLLWVPGNFGTKTCAQGFVWREAFAGDLVCVTTAIRTETLQDNALAASRRQ
jgi:hypothetical protein